MTTETSITRRKYRLTDRALTWRGHTLFRIEALQGFQTGLLDFVRAGELGGWVENESNLSHAGLAWIADEAKAYQSARVQGDAQLKDWASVRGRALVSDSVTVGGGALLFGDATLVGRFQVRGTPSIGGLITQPPLEVGPLDGFKCTILDHHMQVNCQFHSLAAWASFEDRDFLRMMGRDGLMVARKHMPLILDLARAAGRSFSAPCGEPHPDRKMLGEPTFEGWSEWT